MPKPTSKPAKKMSSVDRALSRLNKLRARIKETQLSEHDKASINSDCRSIENNLMNIKSKAANKRTVK